MPEDHLTSRGGSHACSITLQVLGKITRNCMVGASTYPTGLRLASSLAAAWIQ